MLSTQMKGWVGTGALKYSSAMADSNKATDNNTEHVTQKTTSQAQVPAKWHIFHIFTCEDIDDIISRPFTVVCTNSR